MMKFYGSKKKTGRYNLVSEHGFANTWFASKDLVLIAPNNSSLMVVLAF